MAFNRSSTRRKLNMVRPLSNPAIAPTTAPTTATAPHTPTATQPNTQPHTPPHTVPADLTLTEPTVTAIIIARNEEQMLVNCLETLRWCQEIVVLDTGSTDRTAELAARAGAKVTTATGTNFAAWRNEAAHQASSEWLLYIDADERVTPELAKSLQSRMRRREYDAFTLRRNDIHLGKWLQHGGWSQDKLLRLIKRTQLRGWVGAVHEHAEINGRIGQIDEPLVHLTHRNLYDGLHKSIAWTDVEAQLMLAANHPRITPLRLFKIVIFDIVNRLVFKLAWKDGPEGTIEALIQSMNRFLVYVRLWELQQQPSLPARYHKIESTIQKLWQKHAPGGVTAPQKGQP